LDRLVGLPDRLKTVLKRKLLIIELWGLGDLVIATPFLQAARDRYQVTLVAKPYAVDLGARFWPDVEVIPFVAPWTAFQGKYRLWKWPWRESARLWRRLASMRFDVGLSARWDPRDHSLLRVVGARERYGFPRLRSQLLLTHPQEKPAPGDHRYEYWRVLGRALGLNLPGLKSIALPARRHEGDVLIHTGAGQPVRVWPLERYQALIARLRAAKNTVTVACDPEQRDWWLRAGETGVVTPKTVKEVLGLIDQARVFIGNDSGPGHLAALCGVPTFTLFGPQLPEWFVPLHPASRWMQGKACPYKPCSDYCRFSTPICLWNLSQEEVFANIDAFLAR